MSASILVVEDQRSVAGAMRMRLRGLGYEVPDMAKDGAEAIAKAAELLPDLILMDIRLGDGIDGIEAARLIRTRLDIPVVYVTAYADHELLDRARSTQPAGFINKPFTTKDLLTTINLALAREPHEAGPVRLLREAVITADGGGRITFLSAGAERLTGWTRTAAIGRPLAQALRALYGMSLAQAEELIAAVAATRGERTLPAGDDAGDVLAAVSDKRGGLHGLALHFDGSTGAARVAGMQRTQHALHYVLDQLALGVVVVDGQLRIAYRNAFAGELLARAGSVLGAPDGVLRLSSPEHQDALEEVVAAATQRAAEGTRGPAELLTFDTRADAPQLAAIVSGEICDTTFSPDALVSIVLFDLDHRPRLSSTLLHELYGLTRSEINLVQTLTGGASLEDGAHTLGIAINTARTHLKHIFHKTGAKRQSELIHRLETGPAGLPFEIRRRS